MTDGVHIALILAVAGLVAVILICERPPHDPDGMGVDLSGQGREPEAETPTFTPEDAARMEAFILEGIANYEREHGPGSSSRKGSDDYEGTPI